jgi:hypothetical protein
LEGNKKGHINARAGLGVDGYDPNRTVYKRAKNIKITFKGIKGQDAPLNHPKGIIIDGEIWYYNNFLKIETMANGIEYLFDARSYFKNHKSFIKK